MLNYMQHSCYTSCLLEQLVLHHFKTIYLDKQGEVSSYRDTKDLSDISPAVIKG
ncbi:UNVERIFIED_CONTAM: hypothetical protein FKN15_043126 [Acipenser sinensis]